MDRAKCYEDRHCVPIAWQCPNDPGVIYRGRRANMAKEIERKFLVNELIVVEVELTSEDQVFDKPVWLGKEVTGDPRYYNANLIKNPFTHWS
jgi:hypothetical protein